MKFALLGNTYRPIKKNGLITGYDIAAGDLMRSFILHGTSDEIYCLYEPGQYQEERLNLLAEEIKCISPQKRIHMVSEYDLLFRGFNILGDVEVLHSVKEDAIPLVSIRESMHRPIPLTFTMHGLAEQHLIMDTFYPLIYLPFKPYDAVICTSDAVVHTMERMIERLEGLNPALTRATGGCHIRLEKVPLGVDTDYFCPMDKKPLRRKMEIPENAFVILWFGRFSDCFKADLFPLLHIFSQLIKNNPERELRLILAGSQDQGINYIDVVRRVIRNMGIDRYVQIVFNHEIEDRAQFYSMSDVFTSPIDNIQETFGLTPLEAMSCGVPQVVSDWDGYRDTVQNGETGFLVHTVWCDCMSDVARADYLPSHVAHRRLLQRHLAVRSVVVDCTDYAHKLQQLIDDPELLHRMSMNSRIRAKEDFDLQHTVSQTEQLWERLRAISDKNPGDFLPWQLPMVNYSHDFQGYPSQFLTDDISFTISEFGIQCPYSDLPHHEAFVNHVEEAALPELILKAMKNTSLSIADLIRAFPMYTPDQVKREIMFLYKYDMIQPCD